MSLILEGNDYNGELIGQLSTLLTFGASDLGFFHAMTTNGSIVQFPYAWVDTVIQTFDTICAVEDKGSRGRAKVKMELVKFVVQFTACYDEEFETDEANAGGGYESQTLGDQIAEWARMHVDNFSKGLQDVRWSGDTALPSTITLQNGDVIDNTLSKHDGVVLKIQNKGAFDASTNPNGYNQITTATITSTNALQEIGKVADGVTELRVKQHEGFKILVSATVANALITQVRNNNNTTGLTSLPKISLNAETGQLTDGAHFGRPVFVAFGLDAVAANKNAVLAGIFTEGRFGVLKYGVNRVTGKKGVETLTLKEVNDGDAVRFRSVKTQNVEVIPNLSQVAANF